MTAYEFGESGGTVAWAEKGTQWHFSGVDAGTCTLAPSLVEQSTGTIAPECRTTEKCTGTTQTSAQTAGTQTLDAGPIFPVLQICATVGLLSAVIFMMRRP
eukprot:GEMP01094701.1.p2 GENE.GEMP01094701.1~~GEMP01094701.1.p2  ORF type:complete len:108 (+),score=18.48 GEMP01094701.1:24-326(+)